MACKVGKWYQYSGAVHIHTTESDGTLPLADVIALGREVGLDFMMFSDHMGLTNRDNGGEGFHGDTLVLIGYEHNDEADNNHLLVFQSPRVYPENATAKEYVEAARRDRAVTVLAHPIEKRPRTGKYPPYPWLEWSTDQFDGIELWNQMSEWMEKLTPYNKLLMALSPRKSMEGPSPDALRIWDEISRRRKCVGIGGVDAHAFPVDVGPWTVQIFPYKVHFKCIRTHILLEEPLSREVETAKRQFYQALLDCRVYVSNMRWGSADGFSFTGVNGDTEVTAGGTLPHAAGTRIQVTLPMAATIRLIWNGRRILHKRTAHLVYDVREPGLYRVEAWKGRRGWVFSNHIRIGIPDPGTNRDAM
jgi:hypothetical protein